MLWYIVHYVLYPETRNGMTGDSSGPIESGSNAQFEDSNGNPQVNHSITGEKKLFVASQVM